MSELSTVQRYRNEQDPQSHAHRWEAELERISVLGEGASAVSYLCYWRTQQKQVVLKQYKHSFSLSDSQKVWREANVLQGIHHERIPTYLGHYVKEQDGRRLLHLIVEYIEGHDLLQTMQTNRWNQQQCLEIIYQLLQIVQYLQSLQPPILHRDIKTSNILVSPVEGTWKVYLIDFGTAIDSIHSSLGATHNVGTLGYMAPEQISGNPTLASDVYSVGVVAWELFTRRRAKDHLCGFRFEWGKSLRHLSEPVWDWFCGMLDEDVASRIGNATEALQKMAGLPEFDAVDVPAVEDKEQTKSLQDWRKEASLKWLLIAERQTESRAAALRWLYQYGDRCNEGELMGVFYCLQSLSLKRSSIRVVEYIQDLVYSTPVGRQLAKEWISVHQQIPQLEEMIAEIPNWRWLLKSKLRKQWQALVNREQELRSQLEEATTDWLKFVGVHPKNICTLLLAERKEVTFGRPQEFWHLQENSLGMIEVPTVRKGRIWLSNMLITQDMFQEVMGFNPSHHKKSLHPVENVSWWDAVIFCNRLSQQLDLQEAYRIEQGTIQENPQANGFRLPKWEDWKIAARSQQVYPFAGASDPEVVGWVNAPNTQRVAMKEPNGWGFFDMTGNVAEWCWDGENRGTTILENLDRQHEMKRLIAGGSYRDDINWVRIDAFNYETPQTASKDLGFRVARTIV